MTDMPELWWSATLAAERDDPMTGLLHADDQPSRDGWRYVGARDDEWQPLHRDDWPADAVPLVPAEPVDAKGRGPSYRRGFADGQMAGRAALKGAGLTDEETFALEAYFAADAAVEDDQQGDHMLRKPLVHRAEKGWVYPPPDGETARPMVTSCCGITVIEAGRAGHGVAFLDELITCPGQLSRPD